MIQIVQTPAKGQIIQFALSKSPLLAAIQDPDWTEQEIVAAVLEMRSGVGNQRKTVYFDFSMPTPTGSAYWSQTCRDLFFPSSLTLLGYDGAVKMIPTSVLPGSLFIDFTVQTKYFSFDGGSDPSSAGFDVGEFASGG